MMFQVNPLPNCQDSRIWASFDPDVEAVCNAQGSKKVMCWAAKVGNLKLTLRWMDKAQWPPTMTGESYLAMIRKEVGPEVRG